jgi:prevent-host-death family protein
MHMNDWQLQVAQNKFSEVVEEALRGEPQIIMRHGAPVVVVLSVAEHRRLIASQGTLSEFFRRSPLADVELDLSRDRTLPREALSL